MSANNEQQDGTNNKKTLNGNRATSPNPFIPFLSTSPSANISPRSNEGTPSISPRSPRFPASPFSGASISNDMLTAGKLNISKLLTHTIMINGLFIY